LTLFDHALRILDTSMKELRRVAHNMMPEALAKFGLKDALRDFCFELGNNKEIDIKFQFYGDERRLDQNYEISLYRIAQELINNSLKHANPTEILLQVIQEEHRIHLTVQDNGIGFDPEALNASDGTGLANIKSRAESLKGKVDMISIPGEGTEVNVEFSY